MNKQAGVICASGLGDGLLMMIAAERLTEAGYHTRIFTDEYQSLSSLFPSYEFAPYPDKKTLTSFDYIIIQNDNSRRARELIKERSDKWHAIFPKWNKRLKQWIPGVDHLCDNTCPMAQHIANACSKWLDLPASKSVTLSWLEKEQHRKIRNRVVIHPTSRNPMKQWSKEQFISLARNLASKGFVPVFVVSDNERSDWEDVAFDLPKFDKLVDVAKFIHESGYFIGNDSGLGHLASLVGVPTLTIADSPKRIKLWRPNWQIGLVVAPNLPVPNFKGVGMPWRDRYWRRFVSSPRARRAFMRLTRMMS
ncbi:MAG: hypothetical protein H7A40_00670 [Chlamydiales bacterium]|nr:hypothetical protein [Chlamydiales bacterium]